MDQHAGTRCTPVRHDYGAEQRYALTDGYFGLSPRREQRRRWVAEQREHLAIARIGWQRPNTCYYATQA